MAENPGDCEMDGSEFAWSPTLHQLDARERCKGEKKLPGDNFMEFYPCPGCPDCQEENSCD